MTTRKADRIPDYIEHIIAAISQIEKYTAGLDPKSFMENDMAQDATIPQFEIIGEAARRIISTDPEFTKNQPALKLDAAYHHHVAMPAPILRHAALAIRCWVTGTRLASSRHAALAVVR